MSYKPVVLILLHNDSVEANKIAAQVCQQLNTANVSLCALASDKKLVQVAKSLLAYFEYWFFP